MMLMAVVLLATSVGIALVQRSHHRTQTDAELMTAAQQQAAILENYFERARSIILITSRNPVFAEFYEEPGTRTEKIGDQIPELLLATEALAYLEQLYPNAIGEACFIDSGGAENARVVRGVVATPDDLSPDESQNPFFSPTFALPVGRVYQAEPYVSPDTGEWVISNSTPVPFEDGKKRAIVHFEVTVDSFRREAAASDIVGHTIQVLDAETHEVVIDSGHPQTIGGPLGSGANSALAAYAGAIPWTGYDDTPVGRAAFVRLDPKVGNANDWVVVAIDEQSTSTLSGVGVGTLILGLASVLLFVIGAIGYRSRQEELTRAALTDALTGLGNRRALLIELDGRYRAAADAFSLALFDLDGFKLYNDTYGHPAGDGLLIRLSSNLMAIDGDGAQAFRLGGDEFCVIVDGEGPEREELVARATVALTEHGEGFSVSASHGVVDRSEATNPEDLLHIADRRMYARKAARGSGDLHSREVILRMLEARAPELLQHRDELAQLAERIARVMNLDESTVALARLAAELHDVGKIAIPDSILCKAGPLTDEEWAFIQRHSEAGERILDAAPALTPVARLVRAHHERWDGHGYPDGIAGQDIPIEARIAAVVDAYHAMILEDRPHRARISPIEALTELRRNAGTQFDPSVVEAFADVVTSRPAAV